ncbi:MAG: bifunctional hydroxymethylpyrimidine kinase/phosphomethylpyrimidine kinase [Candidatus Eremiobacteraeota bacterium]|nr:bifunctional hydroxymethylpyrimidine kinase/phosphomethylpyrimidine kinase [Candidatus Eremiobacteraeota bacterium]
MIVLSIGTTHPWNVAGVGRDLVVGGDIGARVFTAIAAVSAQDARGVTALGVVNDAVFAAQLAVLPWDSAGAARIGALPTAAAVRAVAEHLRSRPWLAAVVDPVFAASRSGALTDSAARYAVRDELATLGNVVLTPNLEEAAFLLGVASIRRDELGAAATALRARGAAAVLLKGGHLDGDPSDALATSDGIEVFTDSRIAGSMHGTGCTLGMALACELAGGRPIGDAVRAARAYVRAQLARH